ncbi:PREDICTED: F-box protein ETP1-like, partial [Camelina sativa]|uniref:F-box protein ETP1-like n=1 Tax=Camelina sativa TaxID=90675 RepID=A0ABM1R163_CAMSA
EDDEDDEDDGDEDEDDEDDGDEDDVPPLPYVEVKRELSLPDFFNKSLETEVFHCDGLLLCVRDHLQYEIVVWNPFTGQTRWIEANNGWKPFITFVLGYNNNKSSGSQRSYKILCFGLGVKDAEIYDLSSSDSWRRIPDGDLTPPGWGGMFSEDIVSLKGNTYFFAKEKSKPQLGDLSLARFDFSTEKSSLFVPLPYHRPRWEILRLSAVRDEKLSLFLQHDATYKTEIWVTSKIDDDSTKAVSWNKVLAFDLIIIHLQITEDVTFVLDEDKKVALCCERLMDHDDDQLIDKIYILGEDNQVSEFAFDPTTDQTGPRPFPLNYVPSLVQI